MKLGFRVEALGFKQGHGHVPLQQTDLFHHYLPLHLLSVETNNLGDVANNPVMSRPFLLMDLQSPCISTFRY